MSLTLTSTQPDSRPEPDAGACAGLPGAPAGAAQGSGQPAATRQRQRMGAAAAAAGEGVWDSEACHKLVMLGFGMRDGLCSIAVPTSTAGDARRPSRAAKIVTQSSAGCVAPFSCIVMPPAASCLCCKLRPLLVQQCSHGFTCRAAEGRMLLRSLRRLTRRSACSTAPPPRAAAAAAPGRRSHDPQSGRRS